MTHQVIFLSDILRPHATEPAACSLDARGSSLSQTSQPVALTVALRYLAGRGAFKRTRCVAPDDRE